MQSIFSCTLVTHIAVEDAGRRRRVVVFYHGMPQRVAPNMDADNAASLAVLLRDFYRVPLHRDGQIEQPVIVSRKEETCSTDISEAQ